MHSALSSPGRSKCIIFVIRSVRRGIIFALPRGHQSSALMAEAVHGAAATATADAAEAEALAAPAEAEPCGAKVKVQRGAKGLPQHVSESMLAGEKIKYQARLRWLPQGAEKKRYDPIPGERGTTYFDRAEDAAVALAAAQQLLDTTGARAVWPLRLPGETLPGTKHAVLRVARRHLAAKASRRQRQRRHRVSGAAGTLQATATKLASRTSSRAAWATRCHCRHSDARRASTASLTTCPRFAACAQYRWGCQRMRRGLLGLSVSFHRFRLPSRRRAEHLAHR